MFTTTNFSLFDMYFVKILALRALMMVLVGRACLSQEMQEGFLAKELLQMGLRHIRAVPEGIDLMPRRSSF